MPAVLQELLPNSVSSKAAPRVTRKGERIFLRRQRPAQMFFVAGGEVVLERTGRQGEAVVLQRVRRGFVAEASLQSVTYHCDAVVTEPGRVVAIPIGALRRALTQDAAFAMRWIDMLNAEVRRLRTQSERLSKKGVSERLLHLLETEGEGGRLAIDSGLKSLATELAVTHEALYRSVAALEKEGRLRRDGHVLALVQRQSV